MARTYKPEDLCKFLYWCVSPNCDEEEKLVIVEKPYKDEFEPELCDKCGSLMNNKGIHSEEGFEDISFAKTSVMTSVQKKEMFKERSKKHFNKEIKERQHEMIKKFDNGNK